MFIDANVFVNAITNTGKIGINAIDIISKIEKGIINASTNSQAINESVWTLQNMRGKEKAIKYLEKFLSIPNLDILDVNQEVMSLVSELMKKYDLDPTDAIHAATMKYNNIDQIVSEDTHFDRVDFITRKSLR